MKYNICIIRPQNYVHSSAFIELAELVCYGLRDLGYTAVVNENNICTEARNIIIGCHLLDPASVNRLPQSSIILNTEQLYNDEDYWVNKVTNWTSRFETWDYSRLNLEKLSTLPHSKLGFLPIGYHRELARIKSADEQDIDVLFYGSVNERRQKILADLTNAGLRVQAIFGVYGQQRDALIARSKVVLNMHLHKSQIFEIVRVFYLMINGKAVVGEVGERTAIESCYLDGIQPATYDGLVDWCRTLVFDAELRRSVEKKAFDTIRLMPQGELMAPLLTD